MIKKRKSKSPKRPDETKFWKKLAGRARTYWRYYNIDRWDCICLSSNRTYDKLNCASCQKWKDPKDCQVDHIKPLGKGPMNRAEFFNWLDRLNCDSLYLQILDKKCHQKKTNLERDRRKKCKE